MQDFATIHSMGDSPMTLEPRIDPSTPTAKKTTSHAQHQCLPASRDWRSKAHSPREGGWSGISWWFQLMFMFFMFTNVYNHPMKSGKNLVNISKHKNMLAWAGKTIWLVVSTIFKNMKVNETDYPIYYGKYNMLETTNQFNMSWYSHNSFPFMFNGMLMGFVEKIRWLLKLFPTSMGII